MSRHQVAYSATTKEALIQAYGDDTIAGHTNIGNFYHGGGGNDSIDGDSTSLSESHTLFHHVRDFLYPLGQLDMQEVDITWHPVTGIELTASDAAMDMATDTTEQLTIAFTPTNASNKKVTYASSDETNATVSATGLVTAISTGTADITVTTEDGNWTDSVTITVS